MTNKIAWVFGFWCFTSMTYAACSSVCDNLCQTYKSTCSSEPTWADGTTSCVCNNGQTFAKPETGKETKKTSKKTTSHKSLDRSHLPH